MSEKRSPLGDRWYIDQITAVAQQFLRSQPDSRVPDAPPAPQRSGYADLTARAARLSALRARLEQEEAALQADVERLNHASRDSGSAPWPDPAAVVPEAEISAETLTLAEAGRIRRAYKAAEAALPRLVLEAAADGLEAPAIARDLAVTPSYVYRILRERVRYTWRLDVRDGGGWAVRSSGQDVVERALGSASRLAERLLAETGADRVLLWEGPRTTDADAVLDLVRPEGA
ncbi:hypothetical protein ACH4FX_03200 [Streptomyces sp. NPDC018019]|uniref:hypothetical protein n=1 Tax=Streptomyces sp. NPDC018019 TaxID=3365030 RepID=UPI003790A577